ncbi:hypothetical protein [Halomonas nitroreducens]|uniref:Uncharacterized protein n=1 Tax=Halomonas nitroreducens TaxID=447425 RepID=A0A431V813_9GAMM|nr:hypothetical protein [Halomonas nitroreducens]RTR05906.1 hypothetical protein EKG36_03910 [Halomonas nitroreducens]
MPSLITFVLIYGGVLIAIYQIYRLYSEQIVADPQAHAPDVAPDVRQLSALARESARTGASAGLAQAVTRVFGRDIDPRLVLAAFGEGGEGRQARALLRRRERLVCDGTLRVRHLPGWQTQPPRRDLRGGLLAITIVSCLLAIFLGGLSVFTIGYEVPAGPLAWMNSEVVLMLLIYTLIGVIHLVARLDGYLHDLYQIGRLNRQLRAASVDG